MSVTPCSRKTQRTTSALQCVDHSISLPAGLPGHPWPMKSHSRPNPASDKSPGHLPGFVPKRFLTKVFFAKVDQDDSRSVPRPLPVRRRQHGEVPPRTFSPPTVPSRSSTPPSHVPFTPECAAHDPRRGSCRFAWLPRSAALVEEEGVVSPRFAFRSPNRGEALPDTV